MFKVPTIRCPNCETDKYLNPYGYWNYVGPIQCDVCSSIINVKIEKGTVTKTDFVKKASVPTEVKADLEEAGKCYNACAYRACVTMCRRALEGALDAKNAGGPLLVDKLKDLRNRNVLSAAQFKVATVIRQFGNYGAHPQDDLLESVTKGDAEAIMGITEQIILKFFPEN